MLTARQLADWEAYDKIEPVGQYRTDHMMGMLCSLIKDSLTSIFGKKGNKPKPTHPWTWAYWMEEDYNKVKEEQEKKKGAVAIVKEAFGMYD